MPATEPLLRVDDVEVTYKSTSAKGLWSKPDAIHAVNGVSFALSAGEVLGIVGESGCGKSSLIRAICGLNPLSSGEIFFEGEPLREFQRKSAKERAGLVQMIFQDPVAALNPRMTIGEIVGEPIRRFFPHLSAADRLQRVKDDLDRVGISMANINRYPHEFSGGQCQRVGIARALVCSPKLLLCDEPVSALDVSVQAQVINLLKSLCKERGLSMIFVSHDLGVVKIMSDRIMVMYLGAVMEQASTNTLIRNPSHPYTQALLSAIPIPDPHYKLKPQLLPGDLPGLLNLPQGCFFSSRCPRASEKCFDNRPAMSQYSPAMPQYSIASQHKEVHALACFSPGVPG